MNENKNSLDLSGYGTYCGGEFYKVNISGKGSVSGNIDCDRFDVSGMGKVNGDVSSKNLSISGMCTINGDTESNTIDVSGSLHVNKNVNIDDLDVSGIMKIKGKLQANEAKCDGYLKVDGDIECETLDLLGMIQNEGFINCEDLYVQVSGECNCNEIGASCINIEGKSSSIFNMLMPKKFRNKVLTASLIEGDDIKLENCEVKIVRGKNIKIGQNCKIDTIEYSRNIEVDEKSIVKQINKV